MSNYFQLLRPLGSGGNADCWLAIRVGTSSYVVVKFLREHHLPDARHRFKREVKVLRTNAGGLIPVLHADLDGARPYYVMPYLTGGAIAVYAGRLSDGQLRAVAQQLCQTLAVLHSRFVAHGDVKPDNVLVGSSGELRVADPLGNGVGCTILFSHNHGGTPGYWGPEIRAGREISPAGDVYSFGATMYHLATGMVPRDGQRLLISGAGHVSPLIREIVAICCHPSPAARPRMVDLLRILNGERWAAIVESRNKWRAAIVMAGAVGMIAWASGQR